MVYSGPAVESFVVISADDYLRESNLTICDGNWQYRRVFSPSQM